ncbi:MAG: hypothetical protein BRD48_06410 [Bacteroidetes bacterium QS_9_68_14]|nr:MAG: hypothetical protein BRD48_06410 [Bacteroidetes bacterium QS_9_68_14]
MSQDLTNRVAESEIVTFDLEALWDGAEVASFDIAPFLVEGLMLKEEPFREAVKAHDWAQHEGQHVAVACSTDAIVPTWAFMLVATKLEEAGAASVAFGSEEELVRDYFTRALARHDWSQYEGRPVVVKGCAGDVVPESAYLQATRCLQRAPARKLMFGEACSAVPLWRKPQPENQKPEAAGTKAVSADLPTPGTS